jgi:micrococcal nuclease
VSRLGFIVLLAGCYQVPSEVPRGFDDVPIEPTRQVCRSDETETVSCVLDGDTFDVGGCGTDGARERFRLLGIDAPEIAHDTPAECYGLEASAELERLVSREQVLLEFDQECEGFFGRTLAWPHILDEDDEWVNVSLWLVENGYARLYQEDTSQFKSLIYADDLLAARDRAQSRGLGLWGVCGD